MGFDFSSLSSMGSSSNGGDEIRGDISTSINQTSALRNQIANTPQLAKTPVQPVSSVVDPVLDQLITHFGPGPEQAQGEIGELLKEGGF